MRKVFFVMVVLFCLSGCLAHEFGSSDWELPDNWRLFSFDHKSYIQPVNPDELPNVFGVFNSKTHEEVWRWNLGISNNDLKAMAWSDDNKHMVFVYHWSGHSDVYLCEVGQEGVIGIFRIKGWYHDIHYSRIRGQFLLGKWSLISFIFGIPVTFS